ncbi:MAG TPA: hypothetical protein VF701_18420 [Thermoanaerobaculia bacterium]
MRLLLISVLAAVAAITTPRLFADPIYLDQLMETPVAELRRQFPGLRNEGCYRLSESRYLLITIDKDQKPWRIALSVTEPCRRPVAGLDLDIRERTGVEIGDTSIDVMAKRGRPDASAAPEPEHRRLGDTEYLYICRVEESCARHTSIFMRGGAVTAVMEWYSN